MIILRELPRVGGQTCARTGGLGQAQYDLFVPFASLAQSAFLELLRTRTKPLSEHGATPSRHRERM